MLLASVVLLQADAYSGTSAPTRVKPSVSLLREDGTQIFQDADLVFRRGRDVMSDIVLANGNASQYSHIGLLMHVDGRAFVIHAMPDEGDSANGVVLESLESFSNSSNAASLAVYRVEGLNKEERKLITAFAMHQLGKGFDDEFRMSDDTKFYCTELVLKSFAAANRTLVDDKAYVGVTLLPERVVPPDYVRQFSIVPIDTITVVADE